MTTITHLGTYRNDADYPFCPGCGHGSVLDSLNDALATLTPDPASVVIVSDIGCAGLSDQYFATSAFHGLHGRSVTYATGIKLARPDLTVIVIMGDGGTGIGGTHLINAARRNIGITVIVMNNLNFGMTGGQHSTTTPEGSITSTTPGGSIERPLDICGTVGVNGAGYVYRGTSFDADLAERMAEAIVHPGFALLDVWELCTAYFVPKNRMGKKGLTSMIDRLGFERGVTHDREVVGYERAIRARAPGTASSRAVIVPEFTPTIDRQVAMLFAGSAGAKVRSATRLIAEAAIRSGLWARQRGDYPVTVKSGHSVSQLILSPTPEPMVPVLVPDVAVVMSNDGLKKVRSMLASMGDAGLVVAVPGLGEFETGARVHLVDPSEAGQRSGALVVASAAVRVSGAVPFDALRAAAQGPYEAQNMAAIAAGWELGAPQSTAP